MSENDKELALGAHWTRLKVLAGCSGAQAEARETAEHLHPTAAKRAVRGSKQP